MSGFRPVCRETLDISISHTTMKCVYLFYIYYIHIYKSHSTSNDVKRVRRK